MKTEQEQTKQMLKTLCDKFQCSAIDRSYMAKSCRQCEDIIEALHEAGYGKISEYKPRLSDWSNKMLFNAMLGKNSPTKTKGLLRKITRTCDTMPC